MNIERWRQYLLYILLFGAVGLLAELYLLDHYVDWRQWIPLVLLVAGTSAGLWLAVHPSQGAVRTFRILFVSYVPAGLLGVYFHFQSNVEFERELHPNSSGMELVTESLGGAMPTLAPGAMISLGMLGILVCLQHPAAGRSATSEHSGAADPAAAHDQQ